MKNRIFIGKSDQIVPCENNLVNLILENGKTFERLEPRRLFPLNNTEKYISLLDSNGKETAIIRDIKDLDDNSLEVITASLNDYYLVPIITEVISITEKNHTFSWKVNTNRGAIKFDIRNRNHDVRVYDDCSIRVRDSNDNRYLITDYRKLDRHSFRLLSSDL